MPDPAGNLIPAVRGEPGPALSHGCYSLIKLSQRAQAIREEIEEVLPLRSHADGAAVDLLALTLSQVERAAIVLSSAQARESGLILEGKKIDRDTSALLSRLSQDLRGWVSRAERLLGELGLSPKSRIGIGLDVVRTQTAVETLNDYLEAKAAAG